METAVKGKDNRQTSDSNLYQLSCIFMRKSLENVPTAKSRFNKSEVPTPGSLLLR